MSRWVLACCVGIALLASCAKVVAPGGGPEDKQGPRLVAYSPEDKSVRIGPRPIFHFVFDEWIDANVRQPVLISPPVAGKLKVTVDGPRLRVEPDVDLDTGLTYALALSREIKDLRGNSIAQQFGFSLSTGQTLDTLTWEGRVLNSQTSSGVLKGSVHVGLYPSDGSRQHWAHLKKIPDSLRGTISPQREVPLYQVAPDSLGYFKFRALKAGHYRLAAFVDGNGNSLVDAGEAYGIAEKDILFPGDTLPLLVVMDTSTLDAKPVLLSQKLSQIPRLGPRVRITVEGACERPQLSSKMGQIPLTVLAQDGPRRVFDIEPASIKSDSSYVLWCGGVDTLKFRALLGKDTLPDRPESIWPYNGYAWLGPRDTVRVGYRLLPADTSGWFFKTSDRLVSAQVQRTPSGFSLVANEVLPSPVDIKLVQVRPKDSTRSDTVVMASWQTRAPDDVASFEGRVDDGGPWTLTLLGRDTSWTTHTDAQGYFAFGHLRPGSYQLQYYKDLDRNSVWTPGTLSPWRPAEPFVRLAQDILLSPGANNLRDKLAPQPRKTDASNH